MPPCFTVTGGQGFAEFAGVRRMCAGNPGDRALQSLPVSAGYVPGILGQGFAEFAGVRKDVCRESWDRALQSLPVSAGYVPGIRGQGFTNFTRKFSLFINYKI